MSRLSQKNVVLTHDWIDAFGGAERVLESLDKVFSPVEIHMLLANPKSQLTHTLKPKLRLSALQSVPFAFRFHRYLLSFYPRLVERMDVSKAALVISSSHCVAKGVLTAASQLHINLSYTPARYLWEFSHDYFEQNAIRGLKKWYVERVFQRLREWDFISSARVDLFVAISKTVARRIWRAYRRPSIVIYPGVDQKFLDIPPPERRTGDYFVVVSRLVSQKRVDLAVRACTLLGVPLKVVGSGPELEELKNMAGPSIEFLGSLSDSSMIPIIQNARGMIFTPDEDFGIVPLEAQALGIPVLALGRGGALETILADVSGAFFKESSVESLATALREWKPENYSTDKIRKNAARFSMTEFETQFQRLAEDAWEFFQKTGSFDDSVFVRSWCKSTSETSMVSQVIAGQK